MKKFMLFIVLLTISFACIGCGGDMSNSTSSDTIDYKDAESFEKALNNDANVNGKIVQFYVKEYVPNSALGVNCHAGEHLNFIFQSEIDVEKGDTIIVRITEEPSKVFLIGSWEIPCELLEITGKEESDDENKSTESTKITITMDEDDFKGMNYKDAEEEFKDMGFSKFEHKDVDTEEESYADTICYIEINESIIPDSDFKKGDEFDPDSTVTFYTYHYEKPEPVYYSTNDYETAKKGNKGVFSYVDNTGSYDIYWIVDFDEGYVYYFLEGNGDDFCDRLKIDSGNLNTKVTITYHDGATQWSYKLHFKYVNQPSTLIMVDNDGFEFEYSATNLEDALGIRENKTIKDY